jgi:hypothetical protein
MGKSVMKDNRILCPHCGSDITESVNRAMASRAARAWHAKKNNEYYRDLAKKRWAQEKAADSTEKK